MPEMSHLLLSGDRKLRLEEGNNVHFRPNRIVVLGGSGLRKGTTYTRLEVQLIILTIELSVNPVAVVVVAAEEAVSTSPTVVLVPVVAAVVATKFARELADLVATVCNRSDHSSLLQLLFGTRWLLGAT